MIAQVLRGQRHLPASEGPGRVQHFRVRPHLLSDGRVGFRIKKRADVRSLICNYRIPKDWKTENIFEAPFTTKSDLSLTDVRLFTVSV